MCPGMAELHSSPMRVLVTGGAGFIGSHLTEAFLARGDEVLVVDDLSRGRHARLDDHTELPKLSITHACPTPPLSRSPHPPLPSPPPAPTHLPAPPPAP